ncbi:hypothetical protein [Enterococcus faecalis]|uniref:hypothetical protein n=1 Tax=Enterococcus faecalis TaxID=1351 RepID=UPI0001F0B638|nr:hypothetical protein [Enterococcus faecalis]EFT47979.1 hypothetical protein HMPREF9501_01185 [Enterococcus faecalis TX0027]EGO2662739.1 hypothetical protein [Enterococcus faecalis]
MNVEEVLVSQKTPNAINEETELYGFGYGSVVENITVSKGGGGGGCCCCCCCCCGGATGLEE